MVCSAQPERSTDEAVSGDVCLRTCRCAAVRRHTIGCHLEEKEAVSQDKVRCLHLGAMAIWDPAGLGS
jgi:hypothetical protein